MAVNRGYPYASSSSVDQNEDNDVEVEDDVQRAVTAVAGNERLSGRASPTMFNPYYTGNPRNLASGAKSGSIDRQEIIRRKKAASRSNSPELERRKSPISIIPSQEMSSTSRLELQRRTPEPTEDAESIGLQIERPRSAFHRGDFRDREHSGTSYDHCAHSPRADAASALLATSPIAPWRLECPLNRFASAGLNPDPTQTGTRGAVPIADRQRSRAISNASLASSFVYKPPTSPLVQSSRPDTPDHSARRGSRSPDKNRRHTFSPPSLHRYSSDSFQHTYAHGHDRVTPLRSERAHPYRAHQPRKSLDLSPCASLPHAPFSTSRRPSFSESPLHHAPMVGSYEESILRGRMSTTPSKPLNFVAQVGVLGKGNCKPSLRCPSHVSIPFPAVFYSYGQGNRGESSSAQPSPYVGLIDLENTLPSPETSDKRRQERLQAALSPAGSRTASRSREEGSMSESQAQRRRRQKQKRRSGSPRVPSGGCYRIPQQGQLQIVIKNPNKTAVKLFLVPYDLSDMEAGQKTFIRQRSYSAGPIIDMPLSSRKNLGTDRPEAGINPSGDPNDKPVLRYLIHLHICCPSKGRYFLYKSMRVVFANRVPDGKEKLRNEIQLPDPRYSTYRPGRDSSNNIPTPASKYSTRRRSAIEPSFSAVDVSPWSKLSRHLAQSLPSTDVQAQYDAQITHLPTLDSRPASRQTSNTMMDIDSSRVGDTGSQQSYPSSPTTIRQTDIRQLSGDTMRLNESFDFEHDWDWERRAQMAPNLPGARSESLLSRRLLDLAFSQGRSHESNSTP